MPTHIIYIPGLGDRYDPFRRWCLKWWRLWGVTTEHVPITWYDGGSFEQKYKSIQRAIERSPAGNTVIIGESAGATLALHAAKERGISRVITLCGVTRPDTPISGYLRKRAPALDQAVKTLPAVFEVDIHSIRAFMDNVVGKRYSQVRGAQQYVVWSIGHLTTIALCLTLYAPIVTAIAKNTKK